MNLYYLFTKIRLMELVLFRTPNHHNHHRRRNEHHHNHSWCRLHYPPQPTPQSRLFPALHRTLLHMSASGAFFWQVALLQLAQAHVILRVQRANQFARRLLITVTVQLLQECGAYRYS